MYIKKITIKNFRLFSADKEFEINDINTPDGSEGSGLNVFVGENGSGKTALLDAFVLPILEYKTDNFGLDNFNDPTQKVEINIYSESEFQVSKTMPKSSFMAKGFSFEAGLRARGTKAYLSSIVVNDQKYIGVDPKNPAEHSPDLRVSVNNPFSGKRYSENDILYLDKNRLYQTRTGNFNTTRFDRLMEDFNFQYLKGVNAEAANLNEELGKNVYGKAKIKNTFLEQAIAKFIEISGHQVGLDFIENYAPFKNAFFTTLKENSQQVHIGNLGSGYEMIFALLYSFYLAKQSEKQLIVIIDEPELHLHPGLQEKYIAFLLEFSKETQVILTSHSPLLIKQLSFNEKVKISVLEDGEVLEMDSRVLPFISANETNYIAFKLATEEYHNELFEELKYINGDDKNIKDFDNDFFVVEKGEAKSSPWRGHNNEVSEHTYIRNQIHHQKDNGKTPYETLKGSIERMRMYFD